MLITKKYDQNLSQFVEQRRKSSNPFKLWEAVDFIQQMLDILTLLESKGLSHRDIKPSNILYEKGRYILCDFEEAMLHPGTDEPVKKFEELESTTYLYSSPEFLKQLAQMKPSLFNPLKLDVYSLGITLLYFCSQGAFMLVKADIKGLVDQIENGVQNYIEQQD